jgi:hypothetical protein
VLKILTYPAKRDGMACEEFIGYYENQHVPLILSLAPPPVVYKWHYLPAPDRVRTERVRTEGASSDPSPRASTSATDIESASVMTERSPGMYESVTMQICHSRLSAARYVGRKETVTTAGRCAC